MTDENKRHAIAVELRNAREWDATAEFVAESLVRVDALIAQVRGQLAADGWLAPSAP